VREPARIDEFQTGATIEKRSLIPTEH